MSVNKKNPQYFFMYKNEAKPIPNCMDASLILRVLFMLLSITRQGLILKALRVFLQHYV